MSDTTTQGIDMRADMRTAAIWVLAVLGTGIVGLLMANRLLSLGWDRLHGGELALVASACIVVCLWLRRRRDTPPSS